MYNTYLCHHVHWQPQRIAYVGERDDLKSYMCATAAAHVEIFIFVVHLSGQPSCHKLLQCKEAMLCSDGTLRSYESLLYLNADPEEDQTDGFFVAMFQRKKHWCSKLRQNG